MRKVLGVSLGRNSLEAAVVESGLLQRRTVRTESLPLPEAASERTQALSAAFARWKKEHDPDGVAVGLPLQSFSHQVIDMPAMRKADLRNALAFELENYLPLPVEEYLFDFLILSATDDGVRVLVLAVRRELVEYWAGLVRDAGMKFLSIRSSTLESLRGLMESGERQYSGLYLRTDDVAVEAVACVDGQPQLLRTLQRKASLLPELERLAATCPGAVTVSGTLDPVVAARFGVRSFPAPVATGIAGATLKKHRLSVEFVPPVAAAAARDPYPLLMGGCAALAVVLYLLTGPVVYLKERRMLSSIEERRSVVSKKASAAIASKKKVEGLQKERAILFDALGRSNAAARVLRELSELLPRDTWLINFSVDDKGKVEIEGFTGRTSAVVAALQKSALFKNVAFTAPIIAREGAERFALRMEVVGL